MNRMKWNLALAAVVASGVVGCAQCDTCDDFPAPCTGPNCGHPHAPMAYAAPTMAYAAPATAVPAGQPGLAPATADDAAGPAPSVPSPATPPVPESSTPPPPMAPDASS